MLIPTHHLIFLSPRTHYKVDLHQVGHRAHYLPQEGEKDQESPSPPQSKLSVSRQRFKMNASQRQVRLVFVLAAFQVFRITSAYVLSQCTRKVDWLVSQKYFATVQPTDFN